jgi:hypothetical protein
MLKSWKWYSVAFAMGLVISACEESNPIKPVDLDDYFPLKTGLFFVYDVEETAINQNVETKSTYELRVVITDSLISADGSVLYILTRSSRSSADAEWLPLPTWSARLWVNKLVINEGTLPIIALTYPFTINQSWDGNELNTRGGVETCGEQNRACDIFTISTVKKEFSVNGQEFDTGIEVVENDDPDPLTINDVRKVVYGRELGVVFIDRQVLNYCTTPPSCFGTQFVTTGYRYRQSLKSYGAE